MRTVDPDDLNQLAKLLNDRGGVTEKLAAALTSARYLGVTDKLSVLEPLANWSDGTPLISAPEEFTGLRVVRD